MSRRQSRCLYCGRFGCSDMVSFMRCERRRRIDAEIERDSITTLNALALNTRRGLFSTRSIIATAITILSAGSCTSSYSLDCESDAGRHFKLCHLDAATNQSQPDR